MEENPFQLNALSRSSDCDCNPVAGSTFFDPTCLISVSQHGILDTIQKGFRNADIWPNGITGTPDGKKLFVNNWTYDGTGKIRSFTINPNGTLSGMKTLVDNLNFCDGMSMDENNNIYVSGGVGVNAYDPNSKKIMTISPGGGTNNVFAGKDNKLLFMTGPADRITSVKMNVKGVERFGRNENGHGNN